MPHCQFSVKLLCLFITAAQRLLLSLLLPLLLGWLQLQVQPPRQVRQNKNIPVFSVKRPKITGDT